MVRSSFSTSIFAGLSIALLCSCGARAQVMGPCGTPDANKPVPEKVPAVATPMPQQVAPTLESAKVPLPGTQAPNFELDAVVGDNVQKIRLSDFDGKWRVVCFYPADFTFV